MWRSRWPGRPSPSTSTTLESRYSVDCRAHIDRFSASCRAAERGETELPHLLFCRRQLPLGMRGDQRLAPQFAPRACASYRCPLSSSMRQIGGLAGPNALAGRIESRHPPGSFFSRLPRVDVRREVSDQRPLAIRCQHLRGTDSQLGGGWQDAPSPNGGGVKCPSCSGDRSSGVSLIKADPPSRPNIYVPIRVVPTTPCGLGA